MKRRFLSPKQFAKVTGISVKTVYRRCRAGQLPVDQAGGPGTIWRIDYAVYLQRMAAVGGALTEEHAAVQLEGSDHKSLSGPRPKWMNQKSRRHLNQTYDPKEKTK